MLRAPSQEAEEWEPTEEEYVPINIPPEYRDLKADKSELSVRELWTKYAEQNLVLEPDFQRHYVWDGTRASRFIESLLLRLPTPTLFLAEEHDGRWIVVDGHQRLETIFRFLQPLLPGTLKALGSDFKPPAGFRPLELTDLEVLDSLHGRGVDALAIEDREKLWDTKLTVVKIPATAHPDMKYFLFKRLNQGSMSLNSQEIRNCLYRGSYNRLIAELGERHDFLGLWGKRFGDKRMRHRELVLRFFSLLHRLPQYRIPFRSFLDDEMRENQNASPSEIRRFRGEFDLAIAWTERVLGKEAFRLFRMGGTENPSGRWMQRRYDLLYEAEMVGFGQFGGELNRIFESLTDGDKRLLRIAIRTRLIDVMTSRRFLDAINEGTTRPESVRTRLELWSQALRSVIQEPDVSIQNVRVVHQKLTDSNICVVCSNRLDPDDSVWLPGEAASRLVHRFCRSSNMGVAG